MTTKTAIILHTLGVSLIASGIVDKWTISGLLFAAAGGALCAISLEQIAKPKRKKPEP